MIFNQIISAWSGSLQMAWQVVFNQILLFLPNLLAGILVFWLGAILANWVYQLVKKTLDMVQLEKMVNGSGLGQFLKRAEVKTRFDEIIALIVKWLVLIIVLITTLNILGLSGISGLLERVLSFIPRVFSAGVVIAIGLVLAGIIESLLKGALIPFDIKLGRLIGKIGSYLVAILAVMAAFQELGIAQDLIRAIYMGFILSFSLAVGLSIGLGSKNTVEKIINQWYQSLNRKTKASKRK
ncbi:MAG: hypothetical protein GXP43_01035 [bacterium]|nr:hypothetical protein [bacterium]